MTARQALHHLVDDLPEREIATAKRVLEALSLTGDRVVQSLMSAPFDTEADDDDSDGGLTEARREAREGNLYTGPADQLLSCRRRG